MCQFVMDQFAMKELCEHQALSDNTHKFIFNAGSREAVKSWADHIEQLQLKQLWYNKDEMYLLVDARNAIQLPIRYLFEMLSDYNRAYPDLEPPRVKMAFVRSPDTVVLDIYLMMVELFEPPITVQFFMDEDKAQAWLNA